MTAGAFLALATFLLVIGFWAFLLASVAHLSRERNKQDATALRRAQLVRMNR